MKYIYIMPNVDMENKSDLTLYVFVESFLDIERYNIYNLLTVL